MAQTRRQAIIWTDGGLMYTTTITNDNKTHVYQNAEMFQLAYSVLDG